MNIDTALMIFNNVGFPVFIVGVLLFFGWKAGKKLLSVYEKQIEKMEDINERSIEAINNNTKMLEKLCGKIDKIVD